MVNKLKKEFYNTILSQCFSPCGNYLIAGDIYGGISVFHLSKVINPEGPLSKNDQLPKNKFTVKEDIQINSLLSTPSFLIVGLVGEIYGYPWKAVKTSKTPAVAWTIEIPTTRDSYDKTDINCMILNEESNLLYVGCGNDEIYIFSVESRKNVRTLKGHTDYIHCICRWGSEIASSSEDGKVIMWDLRAHKFINKIEPYLLDKIARPSLGKWVGAVGLTDDWLVCGGGPRLSLWHSRFLNNLTVFPIEDEGIHVATINNDQIFAGGRSKLFYQMNINGSIVTEIQTSAVTTYSAVFQEEPFKALCIAGSSNKIDISSNFMYKDIQLIV